MSRDPAPRPVRVLVFTAGTLLIGVGVGMLVNSDLGVTPVDVLTTGLADRFGMNLGVVSWLFATVLVMLALGDHGWRLDVARWFLEGTIFATGLLLDGQVGIGTALFALCTGPVLAAVLPRTMRRMGTEAALPRSTVGA